MGQPGDSGILVPIRDSGASVVPRSDSSFGMQPVKSSGDPQQISSPGVAQWMGPGLDPELGSVDTALGILFICSQVPRVRLAGRLRREERDPSGIPGPWRNAGTLGGRPSQGDDFLGVGLQPCAHCRLMHSICLLGQRTSS